MEPLYLAWLLYLAAIALAVVDIFVPSGGMLLVLASLAAIGSVLFGFRSSTFAGMSLLTLVMASIPGFVFLAIKIWPQTPLGRRIILQLPSRHPADQHASDNIATDMIGRVMKTEMAFLPSGELRVGHQRYSAVAESGFIEAGVNVIVIAVRQRNLIVRVTSEPLTPATNPLPAITPDTQQNLLEQSAEALGLESLDEY